MNLPSHAVSARVGDELRTQAVPVADGLNPSGPAPIALTWHERTTVTVSASQYLVTIPFIGGPVPNGVDRELTNELRRRWVADPTRAHLPWTISLVVAAFQTTRPRGGVLTLALAAEADRVGARLDDLRFLRELRDALEHHQPVARSQRL